MKTIAYAGAMTTGLPNFHDGVLTGLQLGEGTAHLILKRVNGEIWEIALSGVKALQVNDFREGNVIGSFEAIQGVAPDPVELERLFLAPHDLAAPQYHEAHAEFISGKASQVERGEAILVMLTPSYGADLVALCSNVTCRPISTSVG